jgi:ABC transport system ATP-binding/permease protein
MGITQIIEFLWKIKQKIIQRSNKPSPVKAPSTENSTTKSTKLSFKEQKEFETLEIEIQDLEQKKQSLIEQLNAGHEDFQLLSQWATQIEEIKNWLRKRKKPDG